MTGIVTWAEGFRIKISSDKSVKPAWNFYADSNPEGFALGEMVTLTICRISDNSAAVALGSLGGKANKGIPKPKSAENGKKGGRPKKAKTPLPVTGASP